MGEVETCAGLNGVDLKGIAGEVIETTGILAADLVTIRDGCALVVATDAGALAADEADEECRYCTIDSDGDEGQNLCDEEESRS